MLTRSSLSARIRHVIHCHVRGKATRRTNPLGIQMLSSTLHQQLFSSTNEPTYSSATIDKAKMHLKRFDLGSNDSEILDDIAFQLPTLEKRNLNEHFESIARQQSQAYVQLVNRIVQAKIPVQPRTWQYAKGWTKLVIDRSIVVSHVYRTNNIRFSLVNQDIRIMIKHLFRSTIPMNMCSSSTLKHLFVTEISLF
jgi:hypothetical protein